MFNRNSALLEYGNWRHLTHAPMLIQCYVHVKSQFLGKKNIEKFPSLVLPGNTRKKNPRISLLDDYCYSSPSSVANQNAGFALVHYSCSWVILKSVSGRLREIKNKRKFQTFSSNSGRGRLQEVVANKRFPM